jgi:hypothetical protein
VDLEALSDLCTPWCRVIVLGSVSPDDGPRGLTIEMVLAGGKHRSVAEFRQLAREAGLEVLATGRQASGYVVVECATSASARASARA